MDSILTSIKKMLGIAEEYNQFDSDILIHINSTLSILTQLGVGPEEGMFITDDCSTWSDFNDDDAKTSFIKSYVYLKVKMLFDPPSSSAVINSIEKITSELEWRITASVEKITTTDITST